MESLTVTLHDLQELDDDFRAGANHDLAVAILLGVVHRVERIVENGCLDHGYGWQEILKGSALEVSEAGISLQEPSRA